MQSRFASSLDKRRRTTAGRRARLHHSWCSNTQGAGGPHFLSGPTLAASDTRWRSTRASPRSSYSGWMPSETSAFCCTTGEIQDRDQLVRPWRRAQKKCSQRLLSSSRAPSADGWRVDARKFDRSIPWGVYGRGELTSARNSSRVCLFSRKSPSMALVVVVEFCFSTPRMTMQRCRASMMTPTPAGSSFS